METMATVQETEAVVAVVDTTITTENTVTTMHVEETSVRVLRAGEAPIKREFIKPIQPITTTAKDSRDAHPTNGEEGAARTTTKRGGGTFKKRPVDAAADPADSLCRPIAAGETCPFGDSCKFSHDMADYMKRKEKDLGDTCPVFAAVGFCRYGLACRFANHHIEKREDGTYHNITANKLEEHETNSLTNDVRTLLRKNKYPFRSIQQLKNDNRKNHKGNLKNSQQQQESNGADADAGNGEAPIPTSELDGKSERSQEQTVSTSTKLEPASESPLLSERKPIDFKRKIYIAPLTTVGNLPYRRLMKQTGADITCGEMAMATNLLKAQQSEWALLRRHKSEDVFGVQIAGAYGDQMARVCELLTRETDVDFVDINMGCPIDIVCKAGSGAALMNRPPRLMEVVSGALTGIELGSIDRERPAPGLTVKLRTGWSEKTPTAHKLITKLQATRASDAYMNASVVQGSYKLRALQSVDAITIHGRSRLQRYTKNADWDYVYQCSDLQSSDLPRIPFVGGGDVLSFEEFDEHLKNGKLETCMLARGALIKPWLPIEIKERRHYDISASERLDLLKDFVRFGLEHWGSDQKGVNRTRRYLLEWQSFLCRYIPVGLLEVLPQKINERPSPYYGRNDLETLMASDQAVDWVKISEMLLGPVQPGFQFVPKHRANAYVTS